MAEVKYLSKSDLSVPSALSAVCFSLIRLSVLIDLFISSHAKLILYLGEGTGNRELLTGNREQIRNTEIFVCSENVKLILLRYLVNKFIDPELKLIQAEKIDSASSIINDNFNDLFNLDD